MGTFDSEPERETEAIDASLRLLEGIGSAWATQVIFSACELGIPEALEPGPVSVEQIASRTQCNCSALARLLRAMAALSLAGQLDDGRWVLNALGEPLLPRHPKSVQSWVLWWGRHLWPLWGELSNCVRTGESARRMFQGQGGYEHLAGDSAASRLFHHAMAGLTRIHADAILRVCDFSAARKIVDIGGGSGELLFAILNAWPDKQGVLYELPHALDDAKEAAAQQGLSGRCEFVAGSFFEGVPAGSDLYLLKSVVHNWDDDDAVRILNKCAAALEGQAKLLVIERTLSDGPGPSQAASVRSDLNMLVGLGGLERTASSMRALAKAAGLRVHAVVPAGLEFTVFVAQRTDVATDQGLP